MKALLLPPKKRKKAFRQRFHKLSDIWLLAETTCRKYTHPATGRMSIYLPACAIPKVCCYALYPANRVTIPKVMGFHFTLTNPADLMIAANLADFGKFITDWGRYS